MVQPIKLFYSYSHKDERLRQGLETHLSLLRQQGLIIEWHDRNINAGIAWQQEIDSYLNTAHIILLLVSADFLASDYCYSKEMAQALERHQAGQARVIPILLREVDWQQAPFSHLSVLPSTGKPITSRTWHSRDEAFTNVARELRKVIEKLQGIKLENTSVSTLDTFLETDVRSATPDQPGDIRMDASINNAFSNVDVLKTLQKKDGLSIPYILDLNESLHCHTLVLFIGNDLPDAVTGLPSRADLACRLAHRHHLDESLSFAELTQRVSQAGNRWTFTAFLRDALDTAGKQPQAFHQHLAILVQTCQIEMLITTAYDHLLEEAFQQAGNGYNSVVSGSDVPFIRADRPTLLKLYGDIQQPGTLVITERDHFNLLRDQEREALLDEVRRGFRRNTVLFLGYNLSDPDFRFLFDQIAQGCFAHTAYAVWSNLNKDDIQMWRDRGIVVLDANPLDVLEELILMNPRI